MSKLATNLLKDAAHQFKWNRVAPVSMSTLRLFVEETASLRDAPEVAKMRAFVERHHQASPTASIPVDVVALRSVLEEVDRLGQARGAA